MLANRTYNEPTHYNNVQPATFGSQPVTFGNQPATYTNQPVTFGNQPATYVNNGSYRRENYPETTVIHNRQEFNSVERREEPVVHATNTEVHHSTSFDSHQRNTELKRSNVRESRFKEYVKRRPEYKYNLFSIIDEPWNRCCEVGKCGTCPGNECVAKREPKLDWL